VTLSVAGIFKEVSTIFVSTTIFHDELTPINISGLCVTLFGIALYNYLKYAEATSVRGGALSSDPSDKQGQFSPVVGDEPRLGMYNMANESSVFPARLGGGAYTANEETTILGDDSDEESEEGGLKKVHENVDDRKVDLSRLEEDEKLRKLDEEELLFDAELERKL